MIPGHFVLFVHPEMFTDMKIFHAIWLHTYILTYGFSFDNHICVIFTYGCVTACVLHVLKLTGLNTKEDYALW